MSSRAIDRLFGRTRVRRLAVTGLVLVSAACSSTPPAPPPPPRIVASHEPADPVTRTPPAPRESFDIAPRTVESFHSNGQVVRVHVIRTRNPDPQHPAVVMLHGASGLGRGWLLFPHGEELARRGMDVFVVRYYDGIRGNDAAKASSGMHHEREQVISDAIAFVSAQPGVDPSRIGIYGMSLGGFHALSLGAHDSRVAAIANVMGAMPRHVPESSVSHMPPTLLIHGARDRIVPISRMYEVASLLDDIGATYEVKVYMDQAHNLAGAAHTDSVLTVADFFDRQLNGASTSVANAAVPQSVRALTDLAEIKPAVAAGRAAAKPRKSGRTSKATAGKASKVLAKAAPKPAAKPTRIAAKAPPKPAAKPTRIAAKAPPKPAAKPAVDTNQLAATR